MLDMDSGDRPRTVRPYDILAPRFAELIKTLPEACTPSDLDEIVSFFDKKIAGNKAAFCAKRKSPDGVMVSSTPLMQTKRTHHGTAFYR